MPYQTIYSSESATPMQLDDLEEILQHARRSNAAKGITGALVYVDGVFLQILEGNFDAVRELMEKIVVDVRHETITVLKEGEISAAAFADWKMAYVGATAEQVALWAGLSGATPVPDILADMRNDPVKVTQITQSILSALGNESDTPTQD